MRPCAQRRQRLLDRIRERHQGSGAGPPDLDNPVEIHLVLEVQVKVGEHGRRRPGRRPDRWPTSRRPAMATSDRARATHLAFTHVVRITIPYRVGKEPI